MRAILVARFHLWPMHETQELLVVGTGSPQVTNSEP
jgi:hypothetical protein